MICEKFIVYTSQITAKNISCDNLRLINEIIEPMRNLYDIANNRQKLLRNCFECQLL